MQITPADLEAVRAVLAGEVPLTTVASPAYTSVQRVVLAHAAFVAGEYTSPAWKGEFGRLLEQITLSAAVPAEGWAEHDGEEAWEWYYRAKYRLIDVSRYLGLHEANRGGSRLYLTPAAEIGELLRDPELKQAALRLFKQAVAVVSTRRRDRFDQRDRERRFKADAKANSTLNYHLDTFKDDPSSSRGRKIIGELQRLLDLHFGEEPQE